MTRVTLQDALAPAEVDVFGAQFEALAATRSVLKNVLAIEERIEKDDGELDPKDSDRMVDLLGELLDARLKPANGGRKKASAIIRAKWDADQVTLAQIQAFVEDLDEAQFARPT